jgi:hypothetical protein
LERGGDVVTARTCEGSVSTEAVESYTDEAVVSLILCRLAELRLAGCEDDDCYLLAGRLDVDLGRAVDLVDCGCTPELALRILL